jgi:hypothetical protein
VSTRRVQKRKAYLVVGWAGLALSLAYLALGAQLPFGALDQPGAAVFPMVAGVVAILASAATLHEGWRLERTEPVEFPAGADARRVLGMGGLLLGYFVLLPWLGQLLTSLLFFMLVLRLLSQYAWPRIAAYSVVMSLAVYGVFVHLLQVPMPAGVLDF